MYLHQALLETDAHPDVHAYIHFATQLNIGLNVVHSIQRFAETETLDRFPDCASPLEHEIWTNGVKRLVQNPTGKPYAANPDTDVKRILERVYEHNYLYYVEPDRN